MTPSCAIFQGKNDSHIQMCLLDFDGLVFMAYKFQGLCFSHKHGQRSLFKEILSLCELGPRLQELLEVQKPIAMMQAIA